MLTRRSCLKRLGGLVGTALLGPSKLHEEVALAGAYSGTGSHGIYRYTFLSATGALIAESGGPELVAAIKNPSFLELSSDGRLLYAVSETMTFEGNTSGAVASFQVDPRGSLRPQSLRSSRGAAPCHFSIARKQPAMFVANYVGGSLADLPLDVSGAIEPAIAGVQFEGRGPVPGRQDAAHPHCARVSPGDGYVLVTDLGSDRISAHRLEGARLSAQPHSLYESEPGSGPRTLAFHPNGRWAYTTNELANTVDVFAWSEAEGRLSRLQTVQTLPRGFSRKSSAGWLLVDPAGVHVYATNRGHNSVVTFAVDPHAGTLMPLQHVSCNGDSPHFLTLHPSGRWIVVANQFSSSLVVLPRDPRTGMLSTAVGTYPLASAACLVFL